MVEVAWRARRGKTGDRVEAEGRRMGRPRREGGGEEGRGGGEERREGAAHLRPLVEGGGDGAGEVARHALLEPLVEHLVLRQLERLRTRAPRQRR